MNEKITNNSTSEKENINKNKSRIWKFFRRTLLLFIAFLAVLSFALIIIAQTESFRRSALQTVLGVVNSFLIGKVELQDIYFNPAGGLELLELRILAGGDTVAYIRKTAIDIDYFPLFDENVMVRGIELVNPRIKILRSLQDSAWNISKIAEPSTDTTASEPSEWLIHLQKLSIANGSFFMVDSVNLYDAKGRISFVDMHLDSLNLTLSGNINLKKMDFKAKIENLSAIERNSGFRLNEFKSDVALNKDFIEAKSTRIKTPGTSLQLDARLSEFNIFGTAEQMDISKAEFDVELAAAPVNPSDITEFADIYIKLGSVYSIKTKIQGKLNELNVKSLSVAAENTNVNLKGKLYSLLKPEHFRYEMELENSEIHIVDLGRILPEMDFSALPDFKFLKIKDALIDGSGEHVAAKLNANVAEGSVSGKASLFFGKGKFDYKCDIVTEGFNPAQIFKNAEYTGFINSHVVAEGSGYDFQKMNLNVGMLSENSEFYNARWEYANVRASISNGKILLDTLYFKFVKTDDADLYGLDSNLSAFLKVSGSLDLTDFENPGYNLDLKFRGLNPSKILKNEDLPLFISGTLTASGEGFNPDSLTFDIESEIADCLFKDKYIMPFSVNTELKRFGDGTGKWDIESNFINARLEGRFTLTSLLTSVINQGFSLANFSQNKVNKIIPKRDLADTVKYIPIEKSGEFPTLDCRVFADVKDISPVNSFLDGINLYSHAQLSFGIKSEGTDSRFEIDSIKLESFQLDLPQFRMNLRKFNIGGVMNMKMEDSLPQFANLTLNVLSKEKSEIAEAILENPSIVIDFDGEKTDYIASVGINSIIDLESNGAIRITDKGLDINADTFTAKFMESFEWKSAEPLSALFKGDAIEIRRVVMKRDTAETISLSGLMRFDDKNNLNLSVTDMQIHDFFPLAGIKDSDPQGKVYCSFDSLSVGITGAWDNPAIKADLSASELIYDSFTIGNLKTTLSSKDSVISGKVNIFNPNAKDLPELMTVDIRSIPLNLALSNIESRLHSANPVDIKVMANKIPLQIISPFVPQVENLRGNGDADLKVFGFYPEKINYNGAASFDNASFTLINTNISYTARGDISFANDTVRVDKVILNNISEDIPGGEATITGIVDLDNFNIAYVDFSISSKRLLVLSMASVRAMPFLYGDFIISTGEKPIRFYGTLTQPNLEGDVNVLSARLVMPALLAQAASRSSFRYEYLEDRTRLHITTTTDTSSIVSNPLNKTVSVTQAEANFADLIDYNISMRILGRFTLNMDLGTAAKLYAEIGAYDPTQPLWYRKYRNNPEAKLYGQLVVKEGSSLTYIIANLATNGNITFTSGSIENPDLDLKAEYRGKTMEGNISKNYTVQVLINGPKSKPNIKFTYYMDGLEATGDPKKIEEDALMLLLTGKTKTGSSMGGFGNIDLKDNFYSAGQSLVSQSLTSMLLGTGIQSVDVDLAGGAMDETKLKFTGQLFGDVSWTIGGTLADLKSNNEISIDWPISIDSEFLNNFILQITQSTNINTTQTRDQKSWEVKLKVGGSW